jgi:CHAD domain-containing protein
MTPTSGKWIEGIDPEGRVADAARRSLEARLTAVAHALPLAAYLAEHDIEHVHRLRVSTRRAMAALELYRDFLPRKPARWLRKRLKKVRRAAGDARDLDILGIRLEQTYANRAAPAEQVIRKQRADVQPDIIKAAERCRRGDRLVRRTGKLLEGIKPENDAEPTLFREWAIEQLDRRANAFFENAPNDLADTTALHQFRISAKELRYTIELLEAAFDRDMRKEHYPVVEELQECLGKVQDHSAAIDRLNAWADDTKDTEQAQIMRGLAEDERENLIEAVDDFRGWWTKERSVRLRSELTKSSQADRSNGTESSNGAEAATESEEVGHQT